MVLLMASKVSASAFPFAQYSSYSCTRFAASSSSLSAISFPRTPQICLSLCNFQLGFGLFSPWSGLKHLGISNNGKFISIERRKRVAKGKGVFASLFGVGAPEALVIGVVALLVFGPKGLAEVARTLGKTLRAFQPTIKELQDVSREFKTTLEREIGLDEISSSIDGSYNSVKSNTYSNPPSVPKAEDSLTVAEPTDDSPSASKAYTSEEYLMFTEEQLKASVTQEQGQTNLAAESQTRPQVDFQGTEEPGTSAPGPENGVTETATSVPGPGSENPGTET